MGDLGVGQTLRGCPSRVRSKGSNEEGRDRGVEKGFSPGTTALAAENRIRQTESSPIMPLLLWNRQKNGRMPDCGKVTVTVSFWSGWTSLLML
jgi:hypothetical protein